jgi:hypothetical protein
LKEGIGEGKEKTLISYRTSCVVLFVFYVHLAGVDIRMDGLYFLHLIGFIFNYVMLLYVAECSFRIEI